MSSLVAGKTTITILYCQDGLPYSWRETDQQRLEDPGATCKAFWEHILRKVAPSVSVNMVDCSFRCHPQDRADAANTLQNADVFYIRGTGNDRFAHQDTSSYLVDIIDDPSCAELVLNLQYEVLQNRLVYVGVCGAAKCAGESVIMRRGERRRGLELFGQGVAVHYGDWKIRQ